MIKKAVIFSVLFVSTQVSASIPCPTCPKGYVASSLEEVLVAQKQKAQRKTQEQSIKKFAQSSPHPLSMAKENSPKTPVQIVATLTDQLKPIEKPIRRPLSAEEQLEKQRDASKNIEIKARDELIKRTSMLNKNNNRNGLF